MKRFRFSIVTLIVVVGYLALNHFGLIKDPHALTPTQAEQMVRTTSDLFVVDVRTANLYNNGHLKKAVNIPYLEMEMRANEIPTGRQVLIYCAMGKRSPEMYALLKKIRPDLTGKMYFVDAVPTWPVDLMEVPPENQTNGDTPEVVNPTGS